MVAQYGATKRFGLIRAFPAKPPFAKAYTPLCRDPRDQKQILQTNKNSVWEATQCEETLCNFEPQVWPEIITSRDVKKRFLRLKTSCDVMLSGVFLAMFPWSHKPGLLNGRLGNCKIGGCEKTRQPFANPLPTLRQPCANPSPTLRQPFANPLPTFSANPSPSPSFRGPQALVEKHGLTASWFLAEQDSIT